MNRRVLGLLVAAVASAAVAFGGVAGPAASAGHEVRVENLAGGEADNWDWMPQPPDV